MALVFKCNCSKSQTITLAVQPPRNRRNGSIPINETLEAYLFVAHVKGFTFEKLIFKQIARGAAIAPPVSASYYLGMSENALLVELLY